MLLRHVATVSHGTDQATRFSSVRLGSARPGSVPPEPAAVQLRKHVVVFGSKHEGERGQTTCWCSEAQSFSQTSHVKLHIDGIDLVRLV